MRILNWKEKNVLKMNRNDVEKILPRAEFDITKAIKTVEVIREEIKNDGENALFKYAKKFDGVDQTAIKVEENELEFALRNLNPKLKTALEEAERRIRKTHTDQIPKEFLTKIGDGATIKQRFLPVKRVGLYVPGGLAVYPSSVLMNVIPAQVAGVKELVIVSPAQKEFGGKIHPTILACAKMLGVREVYAVGGAGAIFALADGVKLESGFVEPVDMITGPGNIFVAAAKQLVQGKVGIDAVAGPTEIGIIADETANHEFVAADLIGQAEHDPLAASVLFTDSEDFAKRVDQSVKDQTAKTKHSSRVETALEGEQSAIIIVNDINECVHLASCYGAEHLEVQTENSSEVAKLISNAGAIFVGSYSPVPLGDYIAGSNHVLPTGGSSKFSSGLSVYSFLRSVQEINYSENALSEVAEFVSEIANDEDLPAHADAVNIRLKS